VQRFLLAIDQASSFLGKLGAWCIVALTLVVTYEVVVRKFGAPTTWAYDTTYMLYGTLFMLAGAYTLSRNGHVRGDFLYRKFPPTMQAWFDLILYFLFFFPAIFALTWTGWDFFMLSYSAGERSANSPGGPIIWPFKLLIPFVGLVMLMQGVAEVIRCLHCIRDGQWPQRLHDVEEMERLILERAEAERAAQQQAGR
jgi:TRAP-type mannitol/chloroaromatic compound transport system permease small subunit